MYIIWRNKDIYHSTSALVFLGFDLTRFGICSGAFDKYVHELGLKSKCEGWELIIFPTTSYIGSTDVRIFTQKKIMQKEDRNLCREQNKCGVATRTIPWFDLWFKCHGSEWYRS